MTDRELMRQALEKLEFFAYMKSVSEDTARLITALRERLAQPEPKHDDPIGDAQDKLIAEQAARPCKVGGPCVPTQTGPCACKELPPPKLAAWMMRQGYATGHGDSVEALLQELDWQIAENQPQEFVLTQTNVGIGERGMQAYEEAKKRGWVGISDERLMGEQ